MNGLTQILLPLALMGSGLAAGGLVISVRGAPLLLTLPTPQYVPIHQFLVTRFDPFMPISIVTALLTDALLVVAAENTAVRLLCGLAAALLLAAITVSLTKNVPINRWVATLRVDALPPNFEELGHRERWARWNVVRMTLTVCALTVNAVALGVIL